MAKNNEYKTVVQEEEYYPPEQTEQTGQTGQTGISKTGKILFYNFWVLRILRWIMGAILNLSINI